MKSYFSQFVYTAAFCKYWHGGFTESKYTFVVPIYMYICIHFCCFVVFVSTERSCLFVGLSPTTKYRVVVVAENGVSDQDERVDLRKAEIEVITAEGS